jgi:4-aminobutyrate aminotransferase-like enzyme
MGEMLQDGRAMKARYPQIGFVQGKGLVAGVGCVEPGTKRPRRRPRLGRGPAPPSKRAC